MGPHCVLRPSGDSPLSILFAAVPSDRAQRERLPSWAYREAVVAAIAHSQVVVVSGETGCGKTTQARRGPRSPPPARGCLTCRRTHQELLLLDAPRLLVRQCALTMIQYRPCKRFSHWCQCTLRPNVGLRTAGAGRMLVSGLLLDEAAGAAIPHGRSNRCRPGQRH